jgi:hypothetical protein
MNKLILPAVLLSLGLSAVASAECAYPRAPARMPDGATATLDEMKTAQAAVKQYNAEMETYLACIKTEHEEAITRQGASLSEEQKKQMAMMHAQKNDAAVDELQTVAARFNEQVRAYKAKDKK